MPLHFDDERATKVTFVFVEIESSKLFNPMEKVPTLISYEDRHE